MEFTKGIPAPVRAVIDLETLGVVLQIDLGPHILNLWMTKQVAFDTAAQIIKCAAELDIAETKAREQFNEMKKGDTP